MTKTHKAVNLVHLKMNIDQFKMAAQRALEPVRQGEKIIMLPIAAHTLNCFTIELCLKWLIAAATGKIEHGHDLVELFNKISADSKKFIFMFMNIPDADQPIFLQKLSAISTDFVDCRYFSEDMEGLKFDPSFSTLLANTLVEIISLSPKSKPDET